MTARTKTPQLNRQALDEASAWFVDFRVGDADAAARARFDQWLRQSPEHIRAYWEIARTYVELPAIKVDQNIDLDALIASARSDANVVKLEEAVPRSPSTSRHTPALNDLAAASSPLSLPGRGAGVRWALAASIVFAALGLGAYSWYYLQSHPTYTTDIGENRSITLADGSTVDLNARSKLRVEFSKGERDVELLEGQALFEVAHDASRPFVVRSGGAQVRAVGTQFDVYRGSAGTTVTVVEGRVAVAERAAPADSGATFVSAGEQVTVTAQAITPPKHTDVVAATAWTQHRLIFDATPLAEVVEHFNRYNTRQLIIDDPELAAFHVSGVYASTDPSSLIRFLREQPGVVITESSDAVRISRQ